MSSVLTATLKDHLQEDDLLNIMKIELRLKERHQELVNHSKTDDSLQLPGIDDVARKRFTTLDIGV